MSEKTICGRSPHTVQTFTLHPFFHKGTYFTRLLEVKNQLIGTAKAISDAEFKTHIYTSLPSMFDVIVIILQSQADTTIQQVQDALKEHEQNQAMVVKPDAVSEALYTQQGRRSGNQRGRGGQGRQVGRGNKGKERAPKWCDSCKTGTHTTANCWHKDSKNNKRAQDQGTNACYYCAEEGHLQNDCPIKRKANALRNSRNAQEHGGMNTSGNQQ